MVVRAFFSDLEEPNFPVKKLHFSVPMTGATESGLKAWCGSKDAGARELVEDEGLIYK